MKKLFTLLTLALLSIGSAWADSTPGEANSNYLDLKLYSTVASQGNSGMASADGNSVLSWFDSSKGIFYVNGNIYKASNQKWVTNSGGNNTSATWGAKTSGDYVFKSNTEMTATKAATIRSNRTYSYKFTGSSEIAIYAKSAEVGTSGKQVSLSIYELSDDNLSKTASELDAAGVTPTTVTLNGSTDADVLKVSGLATSKKYLAYIYSGNSGTNCYLYAVAFKTVTVTSESFSGVKVGETVLTKDVATSGYTVSGSKIYLTNDLKSLTTPTDVKLVKTVTYSDATEGSEDVDVSFEAGTIDEDCFVGTATIGAIEYSVYVPVDRTVTFTATPTSATLTSTKAARAEATITLTGANLTGTSVTVEWASSVAGMTISANSIEVTDGFVDQEFTILYQSMADVASTVVNLTFKVGENTIVVPITYSSTAADVTTITDVTGEKTWDFSKAGSSTIESPANGYLIPFGNASGFASGFDYQSLSGNAQYFYNNSSKSFQGSQLKFHTTVPGYIKVEFSNTGGDRPYRYLNVNGKNTEYKSNVSNKNVVTDYIAVPAGDVVLKGIMAKSIDDITPTTTENMLRIYNLTFAVDASIDITCEGGLASFSCNKPLDFTGLSTKAYVVTSLTPTSATLEEVTKVPANTGIIVKGTKGETVNVPLATGEVAAPATNLLKAAVTATAVGDDKAYGLSKTDGQFHKLNAGTIPAGKAYLLATDVPAGAPAIGLDFDGETTGIEAIEHSTLNIEHYYNLNGQRVAQPTKGLYIVNGKKIVVK